MSETPPADEFEDGMRKLEALVGQLESGQLTLEQALAAYEEGVGIVRRLNERLCAAEQRLEVLTRSDDGRLQVRPLKGDKG